MNLSQLRQSHRPAYYAALLCFLVLCACLTYWAIVLLTPGAPIAPAEVVADPRGQVDVRPAGNLFGSVNSGPVAAAVSDVKVVGLAATRTRPVAILALDGRPGRPFAVDEVVGKGIRLVDIAADRVTIERDGRRIELAAPVQTSVAVLTSGTGSTRPGDATAGTLPSAVPPVSPTMPGPPPGQPMPPLPPAGAAAGPPPGGLPGPAAAAGLAPPHPQMAPNMMPPGNPPAAVTDPVGSDGNAPPADAH